MSLPSPLNQEFKDGLRKDIASSGGLLLCTDFDGTLVRFTGTPDETNLPDETRDLLRELANVDGLHLAVISGRSFHELAELVPVENATLAGNHGLKIKFEDGSNHELETGEEIHRAIASLKSDLRGAIGGKDGIIIEDKSFGLALHYRQYSGDKPKIREKFYQIWREHSVPELEVIEGAELLEVRPGNWNKGDAVELLREKWGKLPTIYIGDDTTDEDAFRVLRDWNLGRPIVVSPEKEVDTEAQYRLTDPDEVTKFLEEILSLFGSV